MFFKRIVVATFIKYYNHERGEAHTASIDSTDLLSFSETNPTDSQTIPGYFINMISNLLLELPNLKTFSSDRESAMTDSKGGVATKIIKHPEIKIII